MDTQPSTDSVGDPKRAGKRLLISVVVPCYNEEAVVQRTHQELTEVLETRLADYDFELIYVDDGSSDRTAELLRQIQAGDPRVRVLLLSRNFGHQVAVTAGIDHASGDAVVLIDADLQDPPAVIVEMVAKWREGYQVVYGQRTDRAGETKLKLWTAYAFYRTVNWLSDTEIPLDTGDFRLMDRDASDALRKMPEHDRFIRGMAAWVGFRQTAVRYARAERFAGETKYPMKKMIRFTVDAILSFSLVPLRLATALGFLTSVMAFLGIAYAVVLRLFTNIWVSGWTLMFTSILLIGGAQLVCLGIIGEYVGRVYRESKRRPLYLLQARLGFAPPAADRAEALVSRGQEV